MNWDIFITKIKHRDWIISKKGREMKIKELVSLGVFLIGFLFSGFDFGHCEEEFPEWVPREVIEKAQEFLISDKTSSEFLFDMSNKELSKCTLRYPFKIVRVDYDNYTEGDDIKNYFEGLRSSGDKSYGHGFGLYLNDKRQGTIEIGYNKKGMLSIIGSSRIMPEAEDWLAAIYQKYPSDSGYKIIRDVIKPAFFVEKNKEIVQVMTCSAPEGIRFSNPEQHMLEVKKDLIERRKKVHLKSHLENQ